MKPCYLLLQRGQTRQHAGADAQIQELLQHHDNLRNGFTQFQRDLQTVFPVQAPVNGAMTILFGLGLMQPMNMTQHAASVAAGVAIAATASLSEVNQSNSISDTESSSSLPHHLHPNAGINLIQGPIVLPTVQDVLSDGSTFWSLSISGIQDAAAASGSHASSSGSASELHGELVIDDAEADELTVLFLSTRIPWWRRLRLNCTACIPRSPCPPRH
jgi:hypothetical protein